MIYNACQIKTKKRIDVEYLAIPFIGKEQVLFHAEIVRNYDGIVDINQTQATLQFIDNDVFELLGLDIHGSKHYTLNGNNFVCQHGNVLCKALSWWIQHIFTWDDDLYSTYMIWFENIFEEWYTEEWFAYDYDNRGRKIKEKVSSPEKQHSFLCLFPGLNYCNKPKTQPFIAKNLVTQIIDLEEFDVFDLPWVFYSDSCTIPEGIKGIYFAIEVVEGNLNVLYIGKSQDIRNRWKTHDKRKTLQELLLANSKSIQIAWLEICNLNLHNQLEQAFIDHFKPQLNRNNHNLVRPFSQIVINKKSPESAVI